MMLPDQNRERGLDIDAYLSKKIVQPVVLRGFNYLECSECHNMIDLGVTVVQASQWKFSLMGLRPSILGVAKGICPECQQQRKQFDSLITKMNEMIEENTKALQEKPWVPCRGKCGWEGRPCSKGKGHDGVCLCGDCNY